MRSFSINIDRRVVAFLALLFAFSASGQNDVLMTGVDSSSNVVRVLVDSQGRLVTSTTSGGSGAHGACTNTTFNIGTTGSACPPTPRADRSSILIQLVQTGETLRITSDGVTTATATVGVQVSSTGSYQDELLGTVSTNCRCSAATCQVMTVECP